MKVLTLIDRYLPGYKHGGSLRSVANLVACAPPSIEFWIVTLDRDLGDSAPYPGICTGQWAQVERARVMYLPSSAAIAARLPSILRELEPDLLYSNSLFSRVNLAALAMRRLGLVLRTPFLLAPRGELSPGALGLKKSRKQAVLRTATGLGMFHDVVWQASTPLEQSEIRGALKGLSKGPAQRIAIAPDVPVVAGFATGGHARKKAGAARFAFVSRISPKKNLAFALDALRSVQGDVHLEIVGPSDDREYWKACQAKIDALPPNVCVTVTGAVPHDLIPEVFRRSELFVFPTLSENFGHVVQEALAAGCPVLVSDTTPWRGLEEARAGWDLPLDADVWVRALQRCVDMGPDAHAGLRAGAVARARAQSAPDAAAHQTIELFRSVAGQTI
jgi:glycosyltransferase involved in cell wall biosynthesis